MLAMLGTLRVQYVLYEYTRMVCTVHVRYEIRVRYPTAIRSKVAIAT